MFKQFTWHPITFLFLLCFLSLSNSLYPLQFSEVSRFAFTSHDWSSERTPVIDYPFVYMPNSYGFQVAFWDSIAGSFSEVANYGVEGMSSEMVKIGNDLFIAVKYGYYTNTSPSSIAVLRVNVANPACPVASGSILTGEQDRRFIQLRVVNGLLVARQVVDGLITGLSVIDPQTLQIIDNLAEHLYYGQIGTDKIISRGTGQSLFSIYNVSANGFTLAGTINLPYAVGSFPRFVSLNHHLIASQDENELKLWQMIDQDDWSMKGTIPIGINSALAQCNGFLVFYRYNGNQHEFQVYDLTEPDNPLLAHSQGFPDGLETDPSVGNLTACGDKLFLSTTIYGIVALEVGDCGAVSFVSKCYRFNDLASVGHKHRNYILQPIMYGGIACFDISEPSSPIYINSILTESSGWIDVCGDYLLGQFSETGSNDSFFRVYDISTLSSPVLIYETLATIDSRVFFNYSEPGYFYHFESQSSCIFKFQILGSEVALVSSYILGFSLKSPVFCGDYLYMTELNHTGNADLYVFGGFPMNSPFLLRIVPNLVPQPGYVFYAGDYLFLRNLADASQPASFYNEMGSFDVENDIRWGHFRDYVCVSSELGISFYSTAEQPSGFQTPAYILPQHSYTGHIEWDDDFIYLFGQDNVAIYSYDYSAAADPSDVVSPVHISCFPNPAHGDVTIKLASGGHPVKKVDIYNLRGRKLRTIDAGNKAENGYTFRWDGKDAMGVKVSSGIYLVKGVVDRRQVSAKIIILRG